MKRKAVFTVPILTILLAAVVIGGPTLAQTSPGYNLEWHAIGGGGQPVSSASYAVNSTVGQGAASPPYSTSASYVVSGGYWFTAVYAIYLPVVLKSW
jgi:hypothetical protein